MDRPYVARELFTWGSPPSANLLNALDRRLHEDTFDPDALVPIAQLMSVGDINVRSDLQYERYRIARPRALWDLIRRTPGLERPRRPSARPSPTSPAPSRPCSTRSSSTPRRACPTRPRSPRSPSPRPAASSTPHPNRQSVLAAADGEGLVDAAAAGLLNPDQAIFYSAAPRRATPTPSPRSTTTTPTCC